jgi:membrane-bound lytic murein transglycosylase D
VSSRKTVSLLGAGALALCGLPGRSGGVPREERLPRVAALLAEPPAASGAVAEATAPAPPNEPPPGAPPTGVDDDVPGESEASEAQAAQREALELCQSAERLLEQGELEQAVAALDRAYELMLELPSEGDGPFLQTKEDIRIMVANLLMRAYRTEPPPVPSPPPAAPTWDLGLAIVTNDHVQREIRSFTNGEREQFLDAYRRSGRYRPMILAKLEAAGLPRQLSWLPLVESWFKERALSRAAALGMWQFISSTGLRYGLRRDEWIDERMDPEKSADAAIAYLIDLHRMFGDWPKALAGYNCGEARVQRLQRRSAEEYLDFWDLYELLPKETRRYVPRLIAAVQIVENPAAYGLELPEPDPPGTPGAVVRTERAVRLEHLDAALGLEAGTVAALNPELRFQATPRTAYDLRVPLGREEGARTAVPGLPEWKRPVYTYSTHRVRSGETLASIAKRYGTSAAALRSANGLSGDRLRVGQRLRVPREGQAPPRRSRRRR